MDLTAERSQAEADRLYETTVVEAEIVKSNPSVTVSGAENIINKSTVDAILETGLVQDVIWSPNWDTRVLHLLQRTMWIWCMMRAV